MRFLTFAVLGVNATGLDSGKADAHIVYFSFANPSKSSAPFKPSADILCKHTKLGRREETEKQSESTKSPAFGRSCLKCSYTSCEKTGRMSLTASIKSDTVISVAVGKMFAVSKA